MSTGLTVRYLSHLGQYCYYVGTTWNGTPEYTTDEKQARLMNDRQATLAAQAVEDDGNHAEITLVTIDD